MVVADVDRMLRRIIGEDIQLSTVADPDVSTLLPVVRLDDEPAV